MVPARAELTQLQPFEPYLRERLAAVPGLTGRRLHRELTALGYHGLHGGDRPAARDQTGRAAAL